MRDMNFLNFLNFLSPDLDILRSELGEFLKLSLDLVTIEFGLRQFECSNLGNFS